MLHNKALRAFVKKVPGARAAARMFGWTNQKEKPFISTRRMLADPNVPIEAVRDFAKSVVTSTIALAAIEYRRGNFLEALRVAKSILPSTEADPDILKRSWDSIRDLGRYDLALRGLGVKVDDIGLNDRVQARVDHTLFAQDCYEVFSRYQAQHDPHDPQGYVVIFDLGQRITVGLMVPLSYSLLKRGYVVCSATAGVMPHSPRFELQGISSAIRADGTSLTDEPANARELRNQWTVDWDQGTVSCDGINYFAFFLERISKLGKKYRAGLDTPEAQALFTNMLRRSDLAITLCKRLLGLAELGKPIRITSMETHFAPWGIVRRWCEEVGSHHGIHLVSLSNAYENYFSNLTSIESGTLSIEDMTARPNTRHPFLGGRERFHTFIEQHPETLSDLETPKQWIQVDRSRTNADDPLRKEVMEKVQGAKTAGRKVFAAFGKVLIDFAAPDDRGHVFSDFPAWAQSLVKYAEESGAVLIIKPHPHEIRPEIAMEGVETLRDLLPKTMPDNIIFLDHGAFNSYELAELVDASFVWNGTVYCEFPILGCPVVGESIWAERDYPIDSHVVRSEAEYRRIFEGQSAVPLAPDTRGKAAAFLHFIGSPEVMLPFRYIRRAGTNAPIGANKVYHEDLERLETTGDPALEQAAERFFEYI